MTNTANETGQDGLVGQATSQLSDAASSAQDKAVELKEQGRSRLSEQLDERTTQAGEQARSLAGAMRRSGDDLRTEGNDRAAGIATGAADRIERFGDYLERTKGDDMLRDVENFARRSPWMVAGLGLLTGVIASRFLKASSERRYQGSYRSDGSDGRSAGSWQSSRGTSSYEGSPALADAPLSREGGTAG